MSLTDRQRAVVLAVADLTARRGYPPTYREVAAAVGTTSTDTVFRSVLCLRRDGLLRPAPTHNRCLALAPHVCVSRDGRIATIHPIKNAPGRVMAEGAQGANAYPLPGGTDMTIIPDPSDHRAAVIDGLRRLATFLDEHPDVPVATSDAFELGYATDVFTDGGDEGHRAEVDRIASVLGVDPSTSRNGHYRAVKSFGGGITYNAYSIPEAVSARYRAGSSYFGSVTPDGAA